MTTQYHRRVIRIKATDSPNVARALEQLARGEEPDGAVVCPGVLTWAEYNARRATWDPIRQCYGLDAEFYVGAELLLFPPQWLDLSARLGLELRRRAERRARGVGIDPAEGGDRTAFAASDELGVIEVRSMRTPDTNVIVREALAFMQKHSISPDRVCIDRGGGGKQLADRLRHRGLNVRTVPFGSPPTLEPRRGMQPIGARREVIEERAVYASMRAQMYYEFSNLCDPANERQLGGTGGRGTTVAGYGIAPFVPEPGRKDVRGQLACIPRGLGKEGQLKLPPKNRTAGVPKNVKTLVELIGHSPDEADAVVLSTHAWLHAAITKRKGVVA